MYRAFLFVLLFAPSLPAQAPDQWRDKIRRAWMDLAHKTVSAAWEQTSEYYDDGKLIETRYVKRACRPDAGAYYELRIPGNDKLGIVRAMTNVKYKAVIFRSTQNAAWTLKGWDALTELPPEDFLPWLRIGDLRLGCIYLPGFNVVGVEGDTIFFEFKDAGTVIGHVTFVPGTFRPGKFQYWQELSSETNNVHGSWEYTGEVPKRMTVEIKTSFERRGVKVSVVGKEIHTITAFSIGRTAPEEFRLSAYGLSEPAGVVWPTSINWMLWLSCVALAAGVVVYGWKLRLVKKG